MKFVSLLMWVVQFGLSAIFPICFFLVLAAWLRNTYGLGVWVMIVCGIFGVLVSISTVRSCIRSMRKEAERTSGQKETPIAFNDHE